MVGSSRLVSASDFSGIAFISGRLTGFLSSQLTGGGFLGGAVAQAQSDACNTYINNRTITCMYTYMFPCSW